MASSTRTKEERDLLNELTQLTGRSETQVAIGALKAQLIALRTSDRQRSGHDLLEEAKLVTKHLTGTLVDHATLLYDEHGEPA